MQGCQALGMYCYVQAIVSSYKHWSWHMHQAADQLQKSVEVFTASCICGQMQRCYCLLWQLLVQLLVHFLAELLE